MSLAKALRPVSATSSEVAVSPQARREHYASSALRVEELLEHLVDHIAECARLQNEYQTLQEKELLYNFERRRDLADRKSLLKKATEQISGSSLSISSQSTLANNNGLLTASKDSAEQAESLASRRIALEHEHAKRAQEVVEARTKWSLTPGSAVNYDERRRHTEALFQEEFSHARSIAQALEPGLSSIYGLQADLKEESLEDFAALNLWTRRVANSIYAKTLNIRTQTTPIGLRGHMGANGENFKAARRDGSFTFVLEQPPNVRLRGVDITIFADGKLDLNLGVFWSGSVQAPTTPLKETPFTPPTVHIGHIGYLGSTGPIRRLGKDELHNSAANGEWTINISRETIFGAHVDHVRRELANDKFCSDIVLWMHLAEFQQ